MEIRSGLSNLDYHADRTAWSSSQIAVLIKSPSTFYRRFVARTEQPDPPSKSMELGTATHTAALEPKLYESQIAIIPSWALSGGCRRGKLWEKFCLDNRGKILLTKAENVLVQRMHEALEVTAGDWLRGAGHTELSFFWRDAATGLLLKARPDRVVDTVSGDPLVVDVKTSSDASQEGFERSYERFFYGVQESQYTEAIRVRYGREPIYRFVVVQNREPIICNIFRTQADVAVRERDRWRSAVNELAQRLSSGNWEDGYVEREPDEAGW